jgi:transposase-like protein
MSQVDRKNPKRGSASESRFAIFEFQKRFPDDAACLDYLVEMLYPNGIHCKKCGRVTKHYRLNGSPAYSCEFCGRHEHPMAGTIFQDSATSLHLWFYAIYLMSSTRCGISAKQLERELGVTYKTAWRMFRMIRSLLTQEHDGQIGGTVEVDEMYWGGKAKWMHASKRPGRVAASGKQPILAMAQRAASGASGRVIAKMIPDATTGVLGSRVQKKVLPKSIVYTDDWRGYDELTGKGYGHTRVKHSQAIYVAGDAHTNTVEGFFSLVRRGISGAYHAVSTKHLQSYLDEYAFRYNNRDAEGWGMFSAILGRVRKVPASA